VPLSPGSAGGERIGNHAADIAENVWFQVHGEPLTAQRSKRDFTSNPEMTKLGDRE
jgi:phosphate transport system protein